MMKDNTPDGWTTVRSVEIRRGPPRRIVSSGSSPLEIVRFLRPLLPHDDEREKFVVVALDSRNKITGWRITFVGSLTVTVVHPREIFRPLVCLGAAAGVILHTHPSGDPSPSREDDEVTRRMVRGGQLLGIELLDHLVLGEDENYYSFRENRIDLFANDDAYPRPSVEDA